MIFNHTTNTVISKQEIACKTIFSQSLGLMFRKKQNLIMIFPKERKINLHMFFVFYPIDIIIVGEDMKIKEIKRNFKPFTFWNSKEKGKYVIEIAFPAKYKESEVLEFNCNLPSLK